MKTKDQLFRIIAKRAFDKKNLKMQNITFYIFDLKQYIMFGGRIHHYCTCDSVDVCDFIHASEMLNNT